MIQDQRLFLLQGPRRVDLLPGEEPSFRLRIKPRPQNPPEAVLGMAVVELRLPGFDGGKAPKDQDL